MKLSFKPLAAAVAVALASTAAHAQLATPTQGTTTSPTPTTLYVAVWDSSTNTSELVNLSYTFSQLTAAGALTPNSSADPNALNYVTAANPTGAAGNVLQLNFGTLNGWSTNFASPGLSTDYMVLAANNSTTGTPSDLFTYNDPNNSVASTVSRTALTTQQGQILAAIGAWSGASPAVSPLGVAVDKGCTTAYCAIGNNLQSGNVGLPAFNFSNTVGSALQFFNLTATGRSTSTESQYANSAGAGFWFLSTAGDLTWNVLAGAPPAVPLPAAGWLLVSGLLGLGAIGRRRVTA